MKLQPRPGKVVAAALDSMRFTFGRRPWSIQRPIVVQFPINDICDSKCQMCNIWQQKRDRELTATEVRRLFNNNLFQRVTAVGLNGGEPTLRQDLAEVATALFDAMPRLRIVSLITNGLHAERAIEGIESLASAVQPRGGRLDVMVSLDGVGAIHDRVRGVPDNFKNAVRVLDHILSRPDAMTSRVGCTVIRDNVYALHELLDFCIARGAYVKFRLGVPNRRLYNLSSPPPKQIGKRTWIDTRPFELTPDQRRHFGQFLLGLAAGYETSRQQIQFYRSLAAQVLYDAPRRAGCDWQHRGVTVTSRGELAYCAVQSDVLGDGLSEDPETLYFRNRTHLEWIVASKCDSCAHDYVGPPGGLLQMELLADRGLRAIGSSLGEIENSAPVQSLVSVKRRLVDPLRFSRRRRDLLRQSHGESGTRGAAPSRDVLICGWYGTETLGDKAILAAIVGLIRSAEPGSCIHVASLDPAYTRLTIDQMPELNECRVLSVQDALAEVRRFRAVVFGGGPLMAISEMAQMEAIFASAKSHSIPSIVAGCGVGPLGPAAFNRSIRGLLASADRRIFRDVESRTLAARALGLDVLGDPVCEDPAVTWLQSLPPEDAHDADGPVLCLSLRDWPYAQYAPGISARRGERIRRAFEDCIVESIERLAADQPDLIVLPVPFCAHHIGGDDRLLYWRLLRKSSTFRSVCDTSLLSREHTPLEYVRRLRGVRGILAMRFHSIVFASALGIPAVAIDYTQGTGKTHAIAETLRIPYFAVEQVDAAALARSLQEAMAGRNVGAKPSSDFTSTFTCAWHDCVGDAVPTVHRHEDPHSHR